MAPQAINQSAAVHHVSVKNIHLLHADRIKRELIDVGITRFGLKKFAVHYLPRIIRSDEHITGAVYGRYSTDKFYGSMDEGMLVATDRRVLFVDYKPGYTNIKEVTYDVVSDIVRITTGFFSAINLHTKIGNFNIQNANTRCVNTFTEYVEARRLELGYSKRQS